MKKYHEYAFSHTYILQSGFIGLTYLYKYKHQTCFFKNCQKKYNCNNQMMAEFLRELVQQLSFIKNAFPSVLSNLEFLLNCSMKVYSGKL